MRINMSCRPASLLVVALLSAPLPSALSIKPRAHGECLQSDEFANPSVPTFKHFFIQSPEVEEGSRTVNVTVAEDFNVVYYDHFKVVENIYTGTNYVLYHCGRERPADEDLPPNLRNATNPGFNRFFPVPLNRVSVPDTTAFAFLRALGLEDRISFVSQYTLGACAAKMYAEGDGECNKRASYSEPRADEADAVFEYLTSGNPGSEKEISFTATNDPGVLNRAEWVKFMATFFNKEAEANALFDQIATDYNNTKNAVAQYLDSENIERPLIAWVYYQPAGGGGFFSPYYESKVEIKFTYQVQFMEAMGGRVMDFESLKAQYPDNVKADDPVLEFFNISTIGDTLSNILEGVDYLIDETGHDAISSTPVDTDVDRDHVADIFRLTGTIEQRVRNGSVPIIRIDASKNANAGYNWFQDAIARPDLVLRELVKAVWGDRINTDLEVSSPNYLKTVRVLGEGIPSVTLSADKCENEDLNDCTLTSSLICPMLYIDCDGTVKPATTEQRCPPTVSECRAREGTSSSTLDIMFQMNSEYADKIVTNTLEDTNATTFERATVNKVKSALQSARGADSGVTSSAVRLVGVVEAPAASKRRVLLDSHKAIKVSYAVFVQGGDSNQAAKDVHNALSTLTTEDASFWGSELEEFGIMSSTATSDDHPQKQDGSRPALKQTLELPFSSADQASTFARAVGTIRLTKGEVYSTVGLSANGKFAHEYLQSALDGAADSAEDGRLEAIADGSSVTMNVHVYYDLSDSKLSNMQSDEVSSIQAEIFGGDEAGRSDDTLPNPSSGSSRKLLAVVSQLYQDSVGDSGGADDYSTFKSKAQSSSSFTLEPSTDGGEGDDGARGLRAGVLALGGAALLSAFALLA